MKILTKKFFSKTFYIWFGGKNFFLFCRNFWTKLCQFQNLKKWKNRCLWLQKSFPSIFSNFEMMIILGRKFCNTKKTFLPVKWNENCTQTNFFVQLFISHEFFCYSVRCMKNTTNQLCFATVAFGGIFPAKIRGLNNDLPN